MSGNHDFDGALPGFIPLSFDGDEAATTTSATGRLVAAVAQQITGRHPHVAVVDVTADLLMACSLILGGVDKTGVAIWAEYGPLLLTPLEAAGAATSTAAQAAERSREKEGICVLECERGVVVVAVATPSGAVWREFSRVAVPDEQLLSHVLSWALAALEGAPIAEQQ